MCADLYSRCSLDFGILSARTRAELANRSLLSALGVPLATCEHEDHWVALAVGADVQLGREARARAAQGVPVPAASGTSRMLMGANDGAVHVVHGPVYLARSIGRFVQGAQNALPEPAGRPAIEARRHSPPPAITLGQVAPGCPCVGQSKESVDDLAMVFGWSTCLGSRGQQGSKLRPLRVR